MSETGGRSGLLVDGPGTTKMFGDRKRRAFWGGVGKERWRERSRRARFSCLRLSLHKRCRVAAKTDAGGKSTDQGGEGTREWKRRGMGCRWMGEVEGRSFARGKREGGVGLCGRRQKASPASVQSNDVQWAGLEWMEAWGKGRWKAGKKRREGAGAATWDSRARVWAGAPAKFGAHLHSRSSWSAVQRRVERRCARACGRGSRADGQRHRRSERSAVWDGPCSSDNLPWQTGRRGGIGTGTG